MTKLLGESARLMTRPGDWATPMSFDTPEALALVLADVENEALRMAGHRVTDAHDCLLLNCRGMTDDYVRLMDELAGYRAARLAEPTIELDTTTPGVIIGPMPGHRVTITIEEAR
jgi:hypothetical protein